MTIENLSYTALMDAVSEYTRRFIRFVMLGGNTREFQACRSMLDALIHEMKKRKRFSSPDNRLGEQIASLTRLLGGKVSLN